MAKTYVMRVCHIRGRFIATAEAGDRDFVRVALEGLLKGCGTDMVPELKAVIVSKAGATCKDSEDLRNSEWKNLG